MNASSRRQRGSLLIVAMLFCAVIALTLSSYLRVSTSALQLSQRSFLANDAVNLAESGIEMAMRAINTKAWSSPWDVSAGNATATFPGFTYAHGTSGSVKVFVQSYSTTDPVVVAKATITPAGGNGGPIDKMVMVSGFIERSLFDKALVGKHGITFRGNNPSVDSWDSRLNDNGTPRSSPVNYDPSVRHSSGSIASVDVNSTADVNNADIWGTASVGSSSTSAINVGPQGRVGPFGTGAGVKNPDYVSANFTANLPTVYAPTPTVAQTNVIAGNIIADTTLPQTGDLGVTDASGKVTYYYKFPALTGGTLTIAPGKNVVLLPTAAEGTDAISLTGNGQGISVSTGGTLAIYTAANINITGQGQIANANGTAYTSSIQIWGTNTSATSPGQSIKVAGNGSLACTCYAPNAAIEAKGGGNSGAIYGAFVGYSIDLTGNDAFHYDESLAKLGTSGLYMPTKWIELTKASDRALYASHF